MTELEVVIAAVSVDGLLALAAVIACVALRYGWIEGQATLKAVPPWKRQGPETKAPKREPEPSGGDR